MFTHVDINVDNNNASFVTNELQNGQIVNCLVDFGSACTTINSLNLDATPVDITTPLVPQANVNTIINNVCVGESISFEIVGDNWGNNPKRV